MGSGKSKFCVTISDKSIDIVLDENQLDLLRTLKLLTVRSCFKSGKKPECDMRLDYELKRDIYVDDKNCLHFPKYITDTDINKLNSLFQEKKSKFTEIDQGMINSIDRYNTFVLMYLLGLSFEPGSIHEIERLYLKDNPSKLSFTYILDILPVHYWREKFDSKYNFDPELYLKEPEFYTYISQQTLRISGGLLYILIEYIDRGLMKYIKNLSLNFLYFPGQHSNLNYTYYRYSDLMKFVGLMKDEKIIDRSMNVWIKDGKIDGFANCLLSDKYKIIKNNKWEIFDLKNNKIVSSVEPGSYVLKFI